MSLHRSRSGCRLRAMAVALALALASPAVLPVPGLTTSAWAVSPDEVLDDPALEARARHLSAGLRCLVCQNQSIDDSDAELAKDLRVLVRERLKAGDTDGEVIDFLVARYGEFVLLKPRFAWHNAILWGVPPLALGVGIVALMVALRRRRNAPQAEAALSADEEARLNALLDQMGPRAASDPASETSARS
ncbi:cytochrome c-type biogenesis protein [Roseibium aestuarii]|uniref:Cytochrome c-type biogenesis protein n=1 Tax=Roseibium aestuarii TaxID=2600299 RepID=A0ABW4JVV5_9HYPH|nr:cytochrome c-type biogenesis protein [Roseibium aestuarii]